MHKPIKLCEGSSKWHLFGGKTRIADMAHSQVTQDENGNTRQTSADETARRSARGEATKPTKEGNCLQAHDIRPAALVSASEDESSHNSTMAAGQAASAVRKDESNEWHLLDVDGHSVAASSTTSSSNEQDVVCELSSSERCQKRRPISRPVGMDKMASSCGKGETHRPIGAGQQLYEQPLSPALVLVCTTLYALMPLASFLAFLALTWFLFTRYWPITVIYFAYLVLDAKTCNRGGRRLDAVYRSKFWTYLAAYFPIRLSYSDQFKLDPNENYILNYHPHGIAAFGCVSAFATNGLHFSQLFPGIKSRFMVHETSFLVPIMRETFSLRGDCSVNSKSFDYILSKKWKHSDTGKREAGNLLALCGGGLAEADLSDAEHLKVVVATRKGFIKKALIHGANLIPCIGFGENSVFTKINLEPNSLPRRLHDQFYDLFKFKHPIYYGASLLGSEKLRGLLPYKRPITVVMGDPILVKRVEQPSQELIDQLHTKYMTGLRSIYANNQHLCTKYDRRMELV